KEPNLLAWLDLVALSLVCDVMPLKGLTRVLVRQGLRVLQNFDDATAGNLGIRALAAEAGASGGAQASHFGFSVGPRINAAGRIGHARMAFDILTTDDRARATELAHRLQTLNGHRQDVEKAVLEAALSQGEAKGGRGMDTPLVVAAEGWHPGVIGIVAGRLKERFDRPAIVISFEGEEGKGSGRSISGVDLGATIAQAVAEGVIQGGGGHPMAAGLSLKKDQLAAFETYLSEHLAPHIAAARAHQAFYVDGQVRLNGLTREFCDALQRAGPFGNGNPEPRFVIEDVCLAHLRVLKDKHIACSLKDKMGRTGRAIAFGCIGQPLGDLLLSVQEGGFIHLAGRVKPDDWRGGNAGQFQIEDAALVSEVPGE
ncbi:MAG: DHHA1 domain-containing protein, partial [Pseudomonadota bacterium]